MKKELKILLTLLAVIAVAVFVATRFFRKDEAPPVINVLPVGTPGAYGVTLRQEFVRDDSPKKGPESARVTIVEFLDPECESCRAFHPIMKQVLQEYEGGVRLVVRYMAYHTSSFVAVAATEAAGLQGKYWEMQDLLFNSADEWGHKQTPDPTSFFKYATALGLDLEKFKTDLEDPKWQQKVTRDMSDGKVLGVNGTPTVFVNGEMLKGLGIDALRNKIEVFLRAN